MKSNLTRRTRRAHSIPRARPGFTLMEVLAAMAIISVGAAILAPAALRTLDRAAGRAEEKDLALLADSLRRHIVLHREIPGAAAGEWDLSIAGEAALSREQVRVNSRGNERRYLSNFTLPYVQDADGLLSRPNNPRVILLSSMGEAIETVSLHFEDLWEGDVLSAGWTGRESDLKIERIPLGPFFHRIALNNTHSASPSFTVDGAPGTASFPSMRYFLSGTELQFSDPDGALQLVHIVLEDAVFTFSGAEETGHWNR